MEMSYGFIPGEPVSLEASSVEGVVEHLREHGVGVLTGVFSPEDCARTTAQVWDYLEHVTSGSSLGGLRRDQRHTWARIHELLPLHGGLIQHWGVGHTQFAWDIRSDPRVADVFSKLWGVPPQQLLVSFDGANITLPPEVTGRNGYKGRMADWGQQQQQLAGAPLSELNVQQWLHVDQGPHYKAHAHSVNALAPADANSIQGFANITATGPRDGCFTFLDGSHRHHAQFFKERRAHDGNKGDWHRVGRDIDWYIQGRGCQWKTLVAPAGSLVLWDSRLVHSGLEPRGSPSVPRPDPEQTRIVVYVCMTPRAWATPAGLAKRREAFHNRRMTTHVPHAPKLFPELPRSYGNDLPRRPDQAPPVVSELGRVLAGF